jgi:hypothetical protein
MTRWQPAWYGVNDVEIQTDEGVTVIVRATREREGMKLLDAVEDARSRALAVAERIAGLHNASVSA